MLILLAAKLIERRLKIIAKRLPVMGAWKRMAVSNGTISMRAKVVIRVAHRAIIGQTNIRQEVRITVFLSMAAPVVGSRMQILIKQIFRTMRNRRSSVAPKDLVNMRTMLVI